MAWSQDAFNLEFGQLYDKYPNRHVALYRYKVMNFKTSLNKIIVKPRRSVILVLDSETEIRAVQDTYEGSKVTTSISSTQNSGSSELTINETVSVITGDLLPADYRSEFYVYSFNKLDDSVLSTEELFVDQTGASIFPDYQVQFFEDSKNSDKKVTNVMILSKISSFTAGTTSNIYGFKQSNYLGIDPKEVIKLQLPGLLGDFGASFYDGNGLKKQIEYKLIQTSSFLGDRAYALMQMQPTKIRPSITFSSDTFDENKNLTFERASRFITNSYEPITYLWTELGLAHTGRNSSGDLYHAFLTIVFLSQQRLNKFNDYRIDGADNVNLGKIDTTELEKTLYGISVADIMSVEQKEFNATILKTWEGEYSGELKTNDKLKVLYQELKAALAALGEYIPSQYAYGTYQKIGRLALEWYLTPETMNLTLPEIKDRKEFKVKLESEKYTFDIATKVISGLKEEWLKVSGVRTFNLDGQITIPSIPETITEENKDTTAGSVDVTNTNFLNYTWMFQISDKSMYARIFAPKKRPTVGTETSHTRKIDPSGNIFLEEFRGYSDGPHSDGVVKQYIIDRWLGNDQQIVDGTAVLTISSYTTPGRAAISATAYSNGIPAIPASTSYWYEFTWKDKFISANNFKEALKPPFSINQAEWEKFETSSGLNESEFLLDPILLTSNDRLRTGYINEIYWKTTLSNYAIIEFKLVTQDPADPSRTVSTKTRWRLDMAFKKDQTITQEGILI